MSKLRKFTVNKNPAQDRWDLVDDATGRVRATAPLKADLTAGGKLGAALGKEGGTVKIRKEDGTFQEERTFPRSKDPHASKG